MEVGTTIFTIQEENDVSVPDTGISEEENQVGQSGDVNVNAEHITTKHHHQAVRALATPFVRQMAREMKIDIEKVKGSGPAGRITESDLKQFKENDSFTRENAKQHDDKTGQELAPIMGNEREERIPLKGIRKKSLNIW